MIPVPAYAVPTDMMKYFDAVTIADLLSDDGDTITDVTSSPILLEYLLASSGQIEAACEVAELYTSADLQNLSDSGTALLRRIVCTLAAVMLVQRRFQKYGSDFWLEREKWVEQYLDRLRQGQRLFSDPLGAKADAGAPSVDGPSAEVYAYLNMLPDRTQNYYPNRAQRLPLGRG